MTQTDRGEFGRILPAPRICPNRKYARRVARRNRRPAKNQTASQESGRCRSTCFPAELIVRRAVPPRLLRSCYYHAWRLTRATEIQRVARYQGVPCRSARKIRVTKGETRSDRPAARPVLASRSAHASGRGNTESGRGSNGNRIHPASGFTLDARLPRFAESRLLFRRGLPAARFYPRSPSLAENSRPLSFRGKK